MTVLTPAASSILDNWQRDLPLVSRPFAAIAEGAGLGEADVLAQLAEMQANGTIARVGATLRPNTIGASTLAALAVPEWRVDEGAELVGQEPGVNQSYLRENDWNLWFVATAPDSAELAATLARIEARTGLPVLNLPLRRAFNIDLGFALAGPRHALQQEREVDTSVIEAGDRALLQILTQGLRITERPYAALADQLGRSEADVLARIAVLTSAGIITRLGVIVRHRALGWRSNAMVTWNLPDDRIEAAGKALLRHPGITLCYERCRVEGMWDYPLFCMIHAKSRAEALQVLADAAALPELAGATHQVLFSVRCFKQTGAMIARATEAAE